MPIEGAAAVLVGLAILAFTSGAAFALYRRVRPRPGIDGRTVLVTGATFISWTSDNWRPGSVCRGPADERQRAVQGKGGTLRERRGWCLAAGHAVDALVQMNEVGCPGYACPA